jgi:transposase
LAALAVEQAAQLAEQAVLIEALRVELEALRRQVGRDSSNSSQPPSTDGPGAKAKAKAGRWAAGREAQPAPEVSRSRVRRTGPGANRAGSRGIAAAAWPR